MFAAPLLFLALLHGQEGAAPVSDPAKAVLALQEAIRKQPDVEANYTELGNLLLRTQNFPQAIAVLEAARQRFPNNAQAALSLSVAYYGQRRFTDAVTGLLATHKIDPGLPQPVVFLHRLSEHWTDRAPEVTQVFRAYLERHPKDPMATLALGRATADETLLRQAVLLAPRMADAHFELAALLESKREFAAAIPSFERAAQLNPRNPVPHYRLSRLYARSGDRAKAEAARALHEKLVAEEKAEMDRRQAATKHLKFGGAQ